MVDALDETAYRSLFEANPCPMWVFERESLRFLAVNEAAVRQYGYSREEFLDSTILDIRPEEDAAFVRDNVETGSSAPRIWRHRRKDGSTLLAEVVAHSLDFAGVPARLALAVDVTLRERQAELVKATNRTLSTVIAAAPVGILVFDGHGRVTHSNDAAHALLGGSDPASLRPILDALAQGGEFTAREVEIDAGRWVDAHARRVETGPGKDGAVVVLSETTERHAHEARLSQRLCETTLSLKASDAELEGFCYSVSHDLRGPLRAIDGFAQLVMHDEDAHLSPENGDALERVRRAARRMGETIDGLLALSRLAREPYKPRELDLSRIAGGIAESLASANPHRKIEFRIEPDLVAFGDGNLVKRLLSGLLENAVKFSGGQEDATVEVFADGDGWAVRDDGAGFDMAHSGRLFASFERLHGTGEFPGNGLGLALAQRIVRRHGGMIAGEGTVGEGATFRFTLAEPKTA